MLFFHPQPTTLPLNSSAPALVLSTLSGTRENLLAAPAAHPTVVAFVGSACVTCRQKAPSLCSLHTTHPEAVVVAVDATNDARADAQAFANRYLPASCGVSMLLDPGLSTTRQYAVAVVPTVYVISARHVIAYGGVGPDGFDAVSGVLQRLLGGS